VRKKRNEKTTPFGVDLMRTAFASDAHIPVVHLLHCSMAALQHAA
jgi:hypothetical protein